LPTKSGELALTGRRVGAQLRHYHDGSERAVRRDPQSDASCAEAHGVVGLARGGALGPAPAQSLARLYSSEEMTCWPVSARVGNVKNNDPSLIEPIAVKISARLSKSWTGSGVPRAFVKATGR
jgi:hypothetical protein